MAVSLGYLGGRRNVIPGPGYERVLLHEVTELTIDLDDKAGTTWLREVLKDYRVTVSSPRRHSAGRGAVLGGEEAQPPVLDRG